MSDVIKFTLGLADPSLEDEEKLRFASKFLPELHNLDEVEKADRAEDLSPELSSKPGFATLVGVLTAEVSIKNVKAFFGFLNDRLVDKPIKVSVKLGDKEVEIEAKSRQELAEGEKTVLNVIAALNRASDA